MTAKSTSEIPDAIASTDGPVVDRASGVPDQADDRFLPMAFEAICALPVLEAAVRAERTAFDALETRLTDPTPPPAALSFDVRSINVEWPMLEPWSRRPDEPARYVVSVQAKGAMKSIQVAATAAARPLPMQPDPQQEPPAPQISKPKPKPVAAPAPSASAQPATVMYTFETVAKEAP